MKYRQNKFQHYRGVLQYFLERTALAQQLLYQRGISVRPEFFGNAAEKAAAGENQLRGEPGRETFAATHHAGGNVARPSTSLIWKRRFIILRRNLMPERLRLHLRYRGSEDQIGDTDSGEMTGATKDTKSMLRLITVFSDGWRLGVGVNAWWKR